MIYDSMMVDIETTGTRPDRSAMIQLAAVKFSLKDQTVSPNVFNRSLAIPSWRYFDEDTRDWWAKQPETFTNIMMKAEDPAIVMRDFADWTITPGSREGLKFWAKPTTFDYMFVTSYLKDFNQPITFSYREANDMNSFLRGLYYPGDIDRSDEPELSGVAHNALFDTLHQIKVLFHHVDKRMQIQAS